MAAAYSCDFIDGTWPAVRQRTMKSGTNMARESLLGSIRHSVRRKLMVVVLATTTLALLLMGTAVMVYDLRSYHDTWVGDLIAQADLIGRESAPALAFGNDKAARENLSLLKEQPKVSSAALYDAKGAVFASYWRAPDGQPVFPATAQSEGYRVEGKDVVLFKRITANDKSLLGTVYLKASYELRDRLQNYLAILAAVLATSLLVAMLMTSWLQKSVTEPIMAMTDVARQVMSRRDFSLRVDKSTDDEIGYLVDTFNAMLAEIGARTLALEHSKHTLEQEMGERRNAEKALLAADRQKDEFLATLAHELRNPLAPMLTALEILRQPDSSDPARLTAREMLARQTRQLVQLVNDLLDVSRITTGKMVLRTERSELAGIVCMALETVAPLIESRQHRLTVLLPPQPVYLLADAARLAQVFVNLLNNAAKFTDPGGSLVLEATVQGQSLVLSVSDTGIGISPAMLPRVFDMFAQADRSLERPEAGLGVGLSLARYLVELHAGRLTAYSAGTGAGSRFTVSLPALPPALPVPEPAPQARPHSGTLRILLADDNVDFAASLATLLEACGHEVATTHDGMQALETAAAFQPDLCFLDIGLPRLHGYDLARRLRLLPATRDACLVAISGWGQPEDIRRAREAGFDQHLAKPVEFAQIEKLLDGFSVKRAGA